MDRIKKNFAQGTGNFPKYKACRGVANKFEKQEEN